MSWFDQRPDDAMMGSFEAVGAEHIARHAIDGFEAPEIRLRPRPHETADEEAVGEEGADDAAADETRTACNKYALHHGRIVARPAAIFPKRRGAAPVS